MTTVRKQLRMDDGAGTQDGFAIILVVIALAALSTIAATFMIVANTNTNATANLIEEIHAQALADGGVRLAALELNSFRRGGAARLQPGGRLYRCKVPGTSSSIHIHASDETGKVDLNTASRLLLTVFFSALARERTTGTALVDKLIDFRDGDDTKLPNGAEAADYRAAGLDYDPRNGLLRSIEDFEQVLGIPRSTYSEALPHITVHSGQSGIDPRVASPNLIMLLKRGLRLTGSTDAVTATSFPAYLQSRSQRRAYRIKATAVRASGIAYTRDAVAIIQDRPGQMPQFKRWMHGQPEILPKQISPGTNLPDC